MGPPGSGCPSHSEGKELENQWLEMTGKKSLKKKQKCFTSGVPVL
jgi:hypothetical protein